MGKFTLLHTSDWHLGHKLYSRNRDEEFWKFTNWLAELIRDKNVDAVLIAGDVFHTPQPDTIAQKIYYDFLLKAAKAGAKHIIITAGNHDSPAFLTAPKEILSSLNVFVSGSIGDNLEDEVLVLLDKSGQPEAVVCAIPFLREKDVRASLLGEDNNDKERGYREAIGRRYRRLARIVREKFAAADIPIIVTGHLFSANSSPTRSVEKLYAGGEGAVDADIFEDIFDYVALGHIHKPMKIGKSERARYSGSPIPIHFDEADYEKSVVVARFDGHNVDVELCAVPVFQRLLSLHGSRADLLNKVRQLYNSSEGQSAWLELNHDGSDMFANLEEEASKLVKEPWAVLHCNPAPYKGGGVGLKNTNRKLEDFTPKDIFGFCLDQNKYSAENRNKMMDAFEELLALYNEKKREGSL